MISPSGRVPGRASEPSQTRVVDGGGVGTFHGFLLGCPGFSRYGEYMGEEAESGAPWWALTVPRRGPGLGRAWVACGHLAALLQVVFWHTLRYVILGRWQFVPCNSENISCTTFLKYKNSRKQELALWHLVNRLGPENAKYCIKMHIKHVGSITKQAWSIKNYRYVCNVSTSPSLTPARPE